MPLFYTLILIMPPVVAVALATEKRPLETFPLMFFGTISYGYILSILNLLRLSVFLSQGIWAISVIYIVFHLLKKKKLKLFWMVFDLVIIFILAAFLWWLCRGRYYEIWDEISHWGKYLKGMFQNDMLYCLANPLHSFNEYSPSVSIFQYITMRSMPFEFREDISLFVQAIMYAGLLIWPITKFKKKNFAFSLLSIPVLLLVPVTLFLKFYTYILADSGMGMIFGFLLIYYFLEEDCLLKYATMGLGCIALTLTKTAAIGFTAIVIMVVLTNEIITKKQIKPALILPAVCTAGAVFARFSWKIFLQLNNVNLRWTASDFNLESVLNIFSGTAPAYRMETIKLFFTNIFTDRVYGFIIEFSYMEWFVILIALSALSIYLMKKEKRKGFAISFGVVLVSIFLYTISVLVTYLFFFSKGEALGLASISRYLNPVIVGAIILLISFLLFEISYKKTSTGLIGIAAVFVLIVNLGSPTILPFFKTCLIAPTQAAVTANIRNRFSKTAAELATLPGDKEKSVYIVAQRDTGLAHLTLTYELDPITFKTHEASIGERYADWDIWTKFYTKESWQKELHDNFEYLCLFDIDEEFIAQFGELFDKDVDMQNGNIFKVERLPEGRVKLNRIN